MNYGEIIDKLENIERSAKEIREHLPQNKCLDAPQVKSFLAVEPDFNLEYTLEDLYKNFRKKHYAIRLKSALRKRGINTLEDFLSLSPGELLDLEYVGYETLLQTKKILYKFGIPW